MEGGMTRRRGYVWVTAGLALALLALLLWPRSHGPQVSATAADTLELPQVSAPAPPPAATLPRTAARPHTDAHPSHEPRVADPATPAPTAFPRESRRTRVSLNNADTLDLQQLYNIGPVFARRIVNYRTALGGFVDKGQLMEVYGMDSARYADIAPYITLDTPAVRLLDINSATIDQLKRHPYLDYYQAKAIVRLREKEGLYRTASDLKKVPLIDQETYNKISPYITCNTLPNK